jgi:redox-sensing transcriptional repressor
MQARLELPRKSIYRFSLYSRCLEKLAANAVETVSSDMLAKAAGVKSTQLRKDLAYLGNFGRRGLGYKVSELQSLIEATLGTNRLLPVILVGVGNLGTAVLSYAGFAKEGFEFVAAFDVDPHRPRSKDLRVTIHGMETLADFLSSNAVKLAVLTVPSPVAQTVANELVRDGVRAILNLTGALLETPDDVVVNNVNLAIELENLAYFVR